MSHRYVAVTWNRHKRIYDAVLTTGVALFLVTFIVVGMMAPAAGQAPDPMVLMIRATGAAAVTLVHVILLIGPLCRISTRFLPLLYNRRHLGVATFLVALMHAALVLLYYHGFGVMNPLTSLLVNSTASGAPFELLGVAALIVLFLMAATSHDFWLANLGPRWWKTLHMLIYPAYASIVLHVALGAFQADRSLIGPALLGVGAVTVVGAHLWTGFREVRRDAVRPAASDDPTWLDVGRVADIPEGRALTVCPGRAERIAVFRHDGGVSAVSDVCEHQHGPLSEGEVIDGCITCPWHGYQYRPENGQSPPPYTERIATYRVRIDGGRVLVDPRPNPKGTPVQPARINDGDADDA